MLAEQTTRYFIVIEALVVVITLVLGLYTYIIGQAEQNAREDLAGPCCEERRMSYFAARRPGVLSYFRQKKAEIPVVPTIADLIEVGDHLLFTSSLFDHIHPSPQYVCWVSLYEQFFNELAWLSPARTQLARTEIPAISKYLTKADASVDKLRQSGEDRGSAGTERVERDTGLERDASSRDPSSKSERKKPVRHCLYPSNCKGVAPLVRCVLPLKFFGSEVTAEANLKLPYVRSLWLVDREPCIELSREELAGLALVLGIQLVRHKDESISGTGPFGTHLSLSRHRNLWKLLLTHQHRQLDHEAQSGCGYTTLFAKHLACNSLPLDLGQPRQGLSKRVVRSIHVGPDFVEWVCGVEFEVAVKSLRKRSAQEWKPKYDLSPLKEVLVTAEDLKYLYRLPAAYVPDAYCYIPGSGDSTAQNQTDHITVQNQNGNSTAQVENNNSTFPLHWVNGVARIAFGGLVPQAGKYVINAILHTIITTGREDCKDTRRQQNRTSEEEGRQQEQQRSDQSSSKPRRIVYVSGPDDALQKSCSPLTNAMQNLVDALDKNYKEFKLFGDYVEQRARCKLKFADTDCSIQSTPRHAGALFNRYMTALERLTAISLRHEQIVKDKQNATNATNTSSTSETIIDNGTLPPFKDETARDYVKSIYQKCAGLILENFGHQGNTFNINGEVGKVTEKVQNGRRIKVEDCANVARCIIAAWALRVPVVELEWRGEDNNDKAVPLNQLPSVIAFGS